MHIKANINSFSTTEMELFQHLKWIVKHIDKWKMN